MTWWKVVVKSGREASHSTIAYGKNCNVCNDILEADCMPDTSYWWIDHSWAEMSDEEAIIARLEGKQPIKNWGPQARW